MPRVLVILLIALTYILAAFGEGQETAYARDSVTVKIKDTVVLMEGGQAVQVTVKVTCDVTQGEMLEAFIYVVQDDYTSQFAPIPVNCASKQRVYVVQVSAFPSNPPFHRGSAYASAYVLVYDPINQTTVSGGDARKIEIR